MTKIMIVDDDVETTRVLEQILSLAGYESVSVNNSSIAVEVAGLVRPELFLLDLMMPGIDGFKLCRMLREKPEFSHTPIIIVTALGDSDSKVVAFGAGANDYITKPYLPHELVLKIRDAITNQDFYFLDDTG
jgi:DNA-binding response OmpR family regulator